VAKAGQGEWLVFEPAKAGATEGDAAGRGEGGDSLDALAWDDWDEGEDVDADLLPTLEEAMRPLEPLEWSLEEKARLCS
jgi:hypothetical protein